MNTNSICKVLALACSLVFLLFLGSPRAYGQAASNGAILGTVTDPSGAVIPEAKVTVADPKTGRKWETQTSGGGLYDIEALPAEGTLYDVTIEKQGFQTFVKTGNYLSPGLRLSVNATLQLAGAVSEVTVSASVVTVETTTGAASGTIAGNEVTNLQLNGRDFRGLALLVPGVNSGAITGSVVGGSALNGGGLTGETPISVNGLGREMNMYTVDGAYNMNTGNEINLNVTSPVDSIAEFRLLKDNYSAKYGTAGGAEIMVATKSGTSSFHGVAYDFLRNDALDSRNFFSPTVPTLKQNIFGGSIGGPFYIPGHYNTQKNKSFFFANVELRRRNVGAVATGAMIPSAIRNGDFTKSPTLASGGFTLDSTATSILSQEHPGVNCVPDPYHLNTACFDSNAVALMNYLWPLPNNTAAGFRNYINTGVELFHGEDETYRWDQNISEKYRVLARSSYEDIRDYPPYLSWGGNPAPTTAQRVKTTGWNNFAQFTADITPTTINQIAWTQTLDHPNLNITGIYDSDVSGLNLNMPFGAHADPGGRLPDLSLAEGWAPSSDAGFPIQASDGEQVFSEDFTKVKGPHTIQAGTMFIWGIKRQSNFATPEGSYSFSGVHTGDPVADYLLGLDTSFSQNNTRLRGYFRYHQSESYIQDDWRATRRLTLNLGLRAVYFSSDKIQGNGIDDFNPALFNPSEAPVVQPNGLLLTNAAGQPVTSTGTVANLLNGVVFPQDYVGINGNPSGTSGVPDGIFTTTIHWAPRIGFAWDVFGNGKTSLRGGYGIGYERIPFTIYGDNLGNTPFEKGITLLNGSLTNPSLGTPGAIGTQSLGLSGFPPGRDYKPLMIETYSLTVEHQLITNGVFTLAYVGSAARQVPGGIDHNFPLPVAAPSINNPGCLQPGQTIPSGGFQFDPCLNASLVSADYTRPYQGWGGLTGGADSSAQYSGTSNYSSLQAGFNYRAAHGLTFTSAYTYGHALTDVANRGTDGRNTGNGAQNPRDFKAEYGSPGWDRRQIFTSGYVWDLPILKNRKGAVGTAFGNWTFSGLTVIESGFDFAPGMSTSTNGLASRPNCVSGQSISGPKTRAEWFNTNAFVAPPFGFFGNCGTGLIYGPGENTWNWSFFKTFPIKERVNLQFRAEFFNIWNHANFSNVSTGLGAGDFGQVTAALDPRQIEFALRLSF